MLTELCHELNNWIDKDQPKLHGAFLIEDGKIKEKVKLNVPKRVVNIIKCKNPRCITSVEGYCDHVFHLVDEKKRTYRCEYCDDIVTPHINR